MQWSTPCGTDKGTGAPLRPPGSPRVRAAHSLTASVYCIAPPRLSQLMHTFLLSYTLASGSHFTLPLIILLTFKTSSGINAGLKKVFVFQVSTLWFSVPWCPVHSHKEPVVRQKAEDHFCSYRKETEKGPRMPRWTWGGSLCPPPLSPPPLLGSRRNGFSPVISVVLLSGKQFVDFSYHPETGQYWHKHFLDI